MDVDFAFFVVHFGFNFDDYSKLTPRQCLFIRKEYEKKTVADTTLFRDAVLNALYNANRKKGKGFKQLWKKKNQKIDKQQVTQDFKLIDEIEKREKGWVERIYMENGLKPPKKRKKKSVRKKE